MAAITTTINDLPTSTTTTQTASGQVSLVTRTSFEQTNTFLLNAGTSISSPTTTTNYLNCAPCCSTISRLPLLFGPNGKCPNAMDYTQPINLTATIVFTRNNWNELGGTSMEDFCISDSVSFGVVCDNYWVDYFPGGGVTNTLRLSSSYSNCSSVTSPTTRFLPSNPNNWVFDIDLEGFTSRPSILCRPYGINLFDCNCNLISLVSGWSPPYLQAFDCSVPSFTFGTGIVKRSDKYAGNWTLTLTP